MGDYELYLENEDYLNENDVFTEKNRNRVITRRQLKKEKLQKFWRKSRLLREKKRKGVMR